MECSQASGRLSAYLDGEIAAAERGAIEQHVRACPACEAELAALRRLQEALDALTVPAPAGLSLRVHQRLHPRRAVWWQAMSLAASLVLGMLFGGGITKYLYPRASGNGTELAALEEVLQDFPPGSLGGNLYSHQEDEDGSA